MMTRSELAKNRELVKDKAVGALVGLAIGDSFGDACRLQDNRVNYGITTDFNSGASWSTDDTEFALLTAKTLLKCKGNLTTKDVVDAWMEDVCVRMSIREEGPARRLLQIT